MEMVLLIDRKLCLFIYLGSRVWLSSGIHLRYYPSNQPIRSFTSKIGDVYYSEDDLRIFRKSTSWKGQNPSLLWSTEVV